MAREIVIQIYCDICQEDGARKPGAQEVTLTLAELGPAPRVLALCDEHRRRLYDPLRDMVAEFAQKADADGEPKPTRRRRQSDGEVTCPECVRTFPSRNALGSHARKTHDKSVSELLGEPLPFKCEEPGCGKAFGAPQGLAVHLARTHKKSA